MRSTLARLGEIRVPGLAEGLHPPAPFMSLADSVQLLVEFLRNGNGKTTLLTGAGISVDSGIRVSVLPRPASPKKKKEPSLTSCVLRVADRPIAAKTGPTRSGNTGPSFTASSSTTSECAGGTGPGLTSVSPFPRPRCENPRNDAETRENKPAGYPPVRKAESNPTHYAMAALQKMGYVSSIITVRVSLFRSLAPHLSPPPLTCRLS